MKSLRYLQNRSIALSAVPAVLAALFAVLGGDLVAVASMLMRIGFLTVVLLFVPTMLMLKLCGEKFDKYESSKGILASSNDLKLGLKTGILASLIAVASFGVGLVIWGGALYFIGKLAR